MRKMNKNTKIFTASILLVYGVLFLLLQLGVINNYNRTIIILSLINIILAVSLNLTMGFLGQLALGHAGFMAVGAYVSAIITMNSKMPSTIEFALAIVAAGVIATLFGLIIGIPTLRLKGDYLAIVTLAFNEIIRNLLESMKITNGAVGLSGISRYTTFTVAYVFMAITLVVVILLIRSRHGRAIISIKEDEIASEASGINTIYYKLFAFCLSAFFAGIAGALYAHSVTVIQPSDFSYNKSIEIAIMVVFGGLGNIGGSIISSTLLTAIPQFLVAFARYRMLIYSTLLIIFMVLKYNGKLEIIKNFCLKIIKTIFEKFTKRMEAK